MDGKDILADLREQQVLRSSEPPHIVEAFERVYDAIYLLEPEQQRRVLNAITVMLGIPIPAIYSKD